MTKTTVRKHSRVGTKGVRKHTRDVSKRREVPNRITLLEQDVKSQKERIKRMKSRWSPERLERETEYLEDLESQLHTAYFKDPEDIWD